MKQLLTILSDGRFHSGQVLSELLGVSRTMVWKYINSLTLLGLDIHSVKGKGYQWRQPKTLLCVDSIRKNLTPESSNHYHTIELFDRIDSTNHMVADAIASGAQSGYTCLAEQQEAGRGRRGRAWQSTYASSILMSLLCKFNLPPAALTGLSLVIGVEVAKVLAAMGVEHVQLKWPNDIFIGKAKCGGVLIELSGEQLGPTDAIIGVGLNISMETPKSIIDQPWTNISNHLKGECNRNLLVSRLLESLHEATEVFTEEGFSAFHKAWHRYDLNKGQAIELTLANKRIVGKCLGVDKKGHLLVLRGDTIESYMAGELSLRSAS